MKLILSSNKFYIDGNCYIHHFLSLPPLTTCHQNHWLSAEVHFESEPRSSPMGEVTFKKEKLTEHTPSG